MSSRSLRLAAISSIVAGAITWSCASAPDPARFTVIVAPDQKQFQEGVSEFLERRCGTLDCHGQVGRPLRIYGSRGLRLPNDAGRTPVAGGTSVDEIAANYRSVVGLEPEEMSRVVAREGDNPLTLVLLRKPLDTEGGGEQHKGGQVIARGGADPGYVCLTTWLEGAADIAKCKAAAILIGP